MVKSTMRNYSNNPAGKDKNISALIQKLMVSTMVQKLDKKSNKSFAQNQSK